MSLMSPRPPLPPVFPREDIPSSRAYEYGGHDARPPLQGGQYYPTVYNAAPLNASTQFHGNEAPVPPTLSLQQSNAHGIRVQSHQTGLSSIQNHPHSHPTTPAYSGHTYSPHTTQSEASYSQYYPKHRGPTQHMDPHHRQFNSPPLSQVDDRSYRTGSGEVSPDRRMSYSVIPSPAPTATKRPSEDPYEEQAYSQAYGGPSSEDFPFMGDTQISPDNYKIIVRQQPSAARACGFGERDRRVIDPPPIVQLIVTDPATGKEDSNAMRYMFHVVHCTLWSEDGREDETALTGADKRMTRRLMGTLVSSPFVGLDENGKEGCFFCFPDLSCRTHGRYRLRFVLIRIGPSALRPEGYTPIITETVSDVFTVFTAKEFPGMKASTALTKALKRQGCAISVKKGNEKSAGTGSAEGKDEDEDDGEDPASPSSRSKRRRKT